jgi:hypothetical protein
MIHILSIKKQSVLDRILRSYKDTAHGPGNRIRIRLDMINAVKC